MEVIVCLDDRGGMTFNGRRQSRDRCVCEDIIKNMPNCQKLLISEYSRALFDDYDVTTVCTEGFLEIAVVDDICFVENRALLPYLDKIKRITIYKWNRHYPSDMTFDIELENSGFKLFTTDEFEGYSHEKITKEIYVK